MNFLIKLSLVLVLVLVSLSAYLRLSHSGIGCADWPACYGRIGDPPARLLEGDSHEGGKADEARATYQRLVEESTKPLSWATPAHRLVASVLGLLIVGINGLAFTRKRMRLVSACVLGLTVWLALLGIRSESLHDPAVIIGNLGGGFAMLGLLGWMAFASRFAESEVKEGRESSKPFRTGRVLAVIALLALCGQIFLGGMTSANFAATACQTLPDCHGSFWPGHDLSAALDLSRTHEVTEMGVAIGGTERLAIHKAHRLGAVISAMLIIIAALAALQKGSNKLQARKTATLILVLVIMEFSLGVASVMTGLPIAIALGHNALAALLLLALIRLLVVSGSREPLKVTSEQTRTPTVT